MFSDKKLSALRFASTFAIVAVVAMCWSSPMLADITTYTLTGTVSGSITVGDFVYNPGSVGTLMFTDVPFTVTAIGNSTDVMASPVGGFYNPVLFSVNIAGIGTLTPTPAPYGDLFGNLFGSQAVEIEDGNAPPYIGGCSNSSFAVWNGFSPIAVACGGGGLASQPTIEGFLYVVSSASSEFVATSPTPEPAMFAVCGLGLSLLVAIAHRRKRRSAGGRTTLASKA